MRIGILGTGMVGNTIGAKLVALGHEVKMGSRTANNPKAVEWVKTAGHLASQGTFADAAKHGELVFNCTLGTASPEVAKAAGAANLRHKILIDVSNPYDFSKGFPPMISFHGEDSTAEQLQRALPDSHVVKTLNTVNCNVMVDPSRVPGDHDVFVSGNDAGAKARVTEILKDWFGWKSVVDLGDVTSARGAEAYILMWVRLLGTMKSPNFNIKIVR